MVDAIGTVGAGRALKAAVLCLVPPALLALWAASLAAKGPFWLGTNLDPDYQYLLNGLGLLHGQVPGHVDHPGTPVQVLVALVVGATHLLTGRGALDADVLGRPEHYLLAACATLLVLLAAALVVAGLSALRTTGSLVAGLAIQLLPGLSPVVGLHVVCVKPEPVLAALSALLGAQVLRALDAGRKPGRLPDAIRFGLLVGLALATKISAAPLAIVPLVVLADRRARAQFAAAAAATAALATLPAWPALGVFRRFVAGIATHAGRYGTGRPSVFDPAEYLAGLRLLTAGVGEIAPLAVAVACALACLALAWRDRSSGDASARDLRRALCATAAMVATSYLVVARHASAHYVLPAMVVAGLGGALVVHALGRLAAARPWPARLATSGLALLLGVVAVRMALATEENRRWLEGQRRAQLEVVELLAERFPGARVIHFYRSSAVPFALHFGDSYARSRWAAAIEALHPGHLQYNIWADRLETHSPRPGHPGEQRLDYVPLTDDQLCGRGGEGPAVLQGSPLEEPTAPARDVERLFRRVRLVHSTGVEALYAPAGCGEAPGPRPPR